MHALVNVGLLWSGLPPPEGASVAQVRVRGIHSSKLLEPKKPLGAGNCLMCSGRSLPLSCQ